HADLRDLHPFPTRRSSDLDTHPPGIPAPSPASLHAPSLKNHRPCSNPIERSSTDTSSSSWRHAQGCWSVGLLVGVAGPNRRMSSDRKSTRLNSSHVKISYA